ATSATRSTPGSRSWSTPVAGSTVSSAGWRRRPDLSLHEERLHTTTPPDPPAASVMLARVPPDLRRAGGTVTTACCEPVPPRRWRGQGLGPPRLPRGHRPPAGGPSPRPLPPAEHAT